MVDFFKSISVLFALLMTVQVCAEEKHQHWQYEGEKGPEHWAELHKDFELCDNRIGKQQSPINIETDGLEKSRHATIRLSYKKSAAEVVNNGHTVQINLNDGGELQISAMTYKLLQLHFHTPSEEAINGLHYPMVAHLVHSNVGGGKAVIGLLFTAGDKNALLEPIFENLPAQEGNTKQIASFDTAGLLPGSLAHYAYQGSLTTPPCSEGVSWHVLKEPVQMSNEQMNAFKKLFPMNARPLQPLNGRKVYESN